MIIYDLCVAWNWAYDADFIGLLELSCQSRGLSLLQIKPDNLPQMLNSLVGGELSCRVFFDRASDVDSQFMPLIQWVGEDSIRSINTYERAVPTWDKAKMHTTLVSQGLNVLLRSFCHRLSSSPSCQCIISARLASSSPSSLLMVAVGWG